MKKRLLLILIVISLSVPAQAGFLSGNSTPFVQGNGSIGLKLDSSILMVGTPVSAVCLAMKYSMSDSMGLYAKYGVGSIDFTTKSNLRLDVDPQISMGGFDMIFSGTRNAQYVAFVTEYETATWSLNKQPNTTTEIMIGLDWSKGGNEGLRTRYRMALHNFNAGYNGGDDLDSSVKYSLSTELEYGFSNGYSGSFQAGVYIGDKVGGLLSYFGLGFGFNT
jgi:hypothetical protein